MILLSKLWLRLVGFGFYLLYHQFAPTYDLVSWIVSIGKWRAWQLACLPFVRGSDVLELGHGPGHMLLALQRAGYNVTGADLSPQMGRLALDKTRDAGMHISIIQAPAQKLPLATGSFDTVLATFPTEYIVERATLKEVYRVLRENGRFVIVPQAQLTGGSTAVRLLESLYRITGQRNVAAADDGQYSSPSRLEGLYDLFNETGFTVHIEHIKQAGSEVVVIVASRQNRPS